MKFPDTKRPSFSKAWGASAYWAAVSVRPTKLKAGRPDVGRLPHTRRGKGYLISRLPAIAASFLYLRQEGIHIVLF